MGAPDLAIGRRFELSARVGKGAFGEVYRALDRQTGATVAVKRLLEHRDEPILLERFEREAVLLARLDSPYVVGYVAHGHDERGRACIALEWLEGEDLAHRQRAHPLTVSESVEAVRQAALGLAALHEAGIVHRDVKPANFFVSAPAPGGPPGGPRLRVKLIDLGIARVGAEAALTMEGVRIGTPSYMSPEQARGDETVTPRSDLFSLGVVLYELLGGRRPFTGDQELIVLAKIVLHEPPRLDELCPDLSAELTGVVARAIRKSPEARFASAFEMAQALAAAPLPARDTTRPPAGAPIRADESTILEATSNSVSATREQRVVTAIFAGFADTAAPEDDIETFARICTSHGGTTCKTLGWRMIAIFGAVRSNGDEAARASRAALGAAAAVDGIQLSIATGRALAGEGGLSGDAIERGAADRSSAAGWIRIDAPTARLVGAHFDVDVHDGQTFLRGERKAMSAGVPSLLGRESPTVGRERELEMLEALYDECVSEPVARAVLVTAPAGAGKSRVRFELLKRLERRDEPPTVLMARGDSMSAGSPFGMAADAVRHAAGATSGEPPSQVRAKLVRRVARHVRPDAADRVTEFLGELAGVPFDGTRDPSVHTARRDAILMGDAKRAAWEDWLEAECAAGPVLVVFEDLHWGDVPTVKLVDAALRRFADRPLFVLALARPEVHEVFPGLWKSRDLQETRLGSLTRKACERIARAALPDAVGEERIAFVVERAEGNAFYLEELIRAVAEGQSELPDTVLGMVQARLDALGAELKQVLRAASVFGRTFQSGGVACLCGAGGPGESGMAVRSDGAGKAASVAMALEELARREVVLERPSDRGASKGELVFRHALLRDAAYAMLPDADRVAGHRLAGAWLEATGETDAIVLAEHYDRGGEPGRAVVWYLRAAQEALQGNDFDAAIQRAERGAACGVTGRALGALRLLQAEARRWSGDTEQAMRCASDAHGLFPRGTVEWFRAAAELVAATGRRGGYDSLETILTDALGEPAAPGAASAQIASLCPGAAQLIQAGRYEAADRANARLETLAEEAAPLDVAALARIAQLRAFRAFRRGDPEGARVSYSQALEAFEQAGSVRNACIEEVNVAFACIELGRYEEAETRLRRALAAAERMGLQTVQGFAHLNLGRVLMYQGDLEEARRTELVALAIGQREAAPRIEGAARTHLSAIAHHAGDHAASEEEARMAAAVLTVTPPLQAGALASIARALLARGRAAEAREPAATARRVLDSGWTEMFDGLVRLTSAEVLEANGEHDAARVELAAAAAHILGCARRIQDPRARDTYLAVEEHARTLALSKLWGVADPDT